MNSKNSLILANLEVDNCIINGAVAQGNVNVCRKRSQGKDSLWYGGNRSRMIRLCRRIDLRLYSLAAIWLWGRWSFASVSLSFARLCSGPRGLGSVP